MLYLLNHIHKHDCLERPARSYLIKEGKITYINTSMARWIGKTSNGTGLTIAEGAIYTMTSPCSSKQSFSAFKEQQVNLIKKGGTSSISFAQVEYEREIEAAMKRQKHAMVNSTLDYVLGLELPIHLLRPTVASICKRLLIPVIKVHINSVEQLYQVQWEHISYLQLTYPLVLIPVFKTTVKGERSQMKELWDQYCTHYRLQTEDDPANEKWSKTALQKMGLFPVKGELLVSSDFDYQLFNNYEKKCNQPPKKQGFFLDGKTDLDYDKREPAIVALRDRTLKVNLDTCFYPGYGRQIEVTTPRRFLTIHAADPVSSAIL
ncbi:hypothetical protein [Alkalihalophilus marmarensis]|uniref:hypothetical protein n=1 Tax=Alkalihalophilus marmarensis TaxID=521377 RepID=UPI002E2141AF|nr:hypothetical protein [Alkalihalophilus marmarensis]